MTDLELIEEINKMPLCFAYSEGKKVVVTYKGERRDKVFIEAGIVTNIGSTNKFACDIANKFNLDRS